MHFFSYRQDVLHVEGVSLLQLARDVGTPFYCYSANALLAHLKDYQNAFQDMPSLIAYAVKANSNQAVLRLLANHGAGADVVSEGELRRVLAVGIPAHRVVYSGVGKKVEEMDFALAKDICCFNVESEPELEQLSARAVALSKQHVFLCALIPMWMLKPIRRLQLASLRINLVFRCRWLGMLIKKQPNCLVLMFVVLIFILVAKFVT